MAKLERLDKVLANMGYGSRKDVKNHIKNGIVKVNGNIIKDRETKVNPYEDEITINGEVVNYREYIYLMMNKPQGLVSSTDDPLTRTVIDLLSDEYLIYEPFPVGRLDKDTEGLLLISNDGKLAHELLSPKKGVYKTYFAEVDGTVEDDHVGIFNKGLTLDDGYMTLPARLEILESGIVSKVNLTIQEGKYHQVKRMFESIGMKVLFLKRISMGPLKLDPSLEPGEYRELNEEEINMLKFR
ncbi:rRNA pseudouridine synthase [Tissierella creatinini]|nr:rRNA pseudouridine synthase [Tissierella creatinini]TJX63798.1 rRNA pseudouridine synthase [Soehngenia saccharolytica]